MDVSVMVNRVMRSYVNDLPEVTHNAYHYFGYDKPVVEERVNRGDPKIPYYTAKDFNDNAYQMLVSAALTQVNPILEKYSHTVACEDALHTTIRTFEQGVFDGKINANCFNVLLKGMLQMKSAKKKKDVEVTPKALKELGIKKHEVPYKNQSHKIYRERGKVLLEKKDN